MRVDRMDKSIHKREVTTQRSRIAHAIRSTDGHGRGTTYQLKEESERRTLQAKQETLQAGEENANPMPKRMSREELAEKIVDFCSEWRTAEEIAGFIQRNKRYLSNEVLPKMGNFLELKYPQVKRHPDQKYRSRTIHGKRPEA